MTLDSATWWANPAVDNAPMELTEESISAVADTDVEEYIADRLWRKWREYGYDTNMFLLTLPQGAKAFFITNLIEAEVDNGGFNQLYWNGYNDLANLAPSAFEYFGAHEHATIMREAIFVRGKEKFLIGLLKLIGTTSAFSWSYKLSRLEPVSRSFWDLSGKLNPLRVAKIRSSPMLFASGI